MSLMQRTVPYNLASRTTAFFRGLQYMQPLVEVARSGMCGSYSLTNRQRAIYSSRIGRACNFAQVCRLLEKSTSADSQETLAKLVKLHIKQELGHFYSLLPNPWEKAETDTLQRFMTARAEGFMDMRERICEILAAGTVKSEKARTALLSTLLHSNLMDGFCGQEKKRQEFIKSLKECGAITEKEAREVGYLARKSGQVLFFS